MNINNFINKFSQDENLFNEIYKNIITNQKELDKLGQLHIPIDPSDIEGFPTKDIFDYFIKTKMMAQHFLNVYRNNEYFIDSFENMIFKDSKIMNTFKGLNIEDRAKNVTKLCLEYAVLLQMLLSKEEDKSDDEEEIYMAKSSNSLTEKTGNNLSVTLPSTKVKKESTQQHGFCIYCDTKLTEDDTRCSVCEAEVKNGYNVIVGNLKKNVNENEGVIKECKRKDSLSSVESLGNDENNLVLDNKIVFKINENKTIFKDELNNVKTLSYADNKRNGEHINNLYKPREMLQTDNCDWVCSFCSFKNTNTDFNCSTCLVCLKEGKPSTEHNKLDNNHGKKTGTNSNVFKVKDNLSKKEIVKSENEENTDISNSSIKSEDFSNCKSLDKKSPQPRSEGTTNSKKLLNQSKQYLNENHEKKYNKNEVQLILPEGCRTCSNCTTDSKEGSVKCENCSAEKVKDTKTDKQGLTIKNEDNVNKRNYYKNEFNHNIKNTQVEHSHEKYEEKVVKSMPNKKEYNVAVPFELNKSLDYPLQNKRKKVPKEEICDWQCQRCGFKNIDISVKCETCLACLGEGKPNSKLNFEKEKKGKENISQENKIKIENSNFNTNSTEKEISVKNEINKNVENVFSEQTNENIKIKTSQNHSSIAPLKNKDDEVSSTLGSDCDSPHVSIKEKVTESSESKNTHSKVEHKASENINNHKIKENIINNKQHNEDSETLNIKKNKEQDRNVKKSQNSHHKINSENFTENKHNLTLTSQKSTQNSERKEREIREMSTQLSYNSKSPSGGQSKQAVRSDMPSSSSYGAHHQTQKNNNSIQTQSNISKEKNTGSWLTCFRSENKKASAKNKCSHCNKRSAKSKYQNLCKKCHKEYNKHNNSKGIIKKNIPKK